MVSAAARLLDYEAKNPSVSVGWFWYKNFQPKVYKLLGRVPPKKDSKKFGEL
jgi:hypothetical protein